ncbi:ubiquitin-conjugating enzyme E2 C-like [Hippopotamus amphibius kiboko]|uniref:ubiquitin-conjugating enzyme E2 C-like n=1 Tax=Hippopotamus amphibius kiboko TaxID=575201 RepID=UPI002592CCAD|nr:ubiquitin-conjugating enzyme E2 C-like [Hippopotamus amphibius kiboko]
MASQNHDPQQLFKEWDVPQCGRQQPVGKRLLQELETLRKSRDKGISAYPESDFSKRVGTIHGAVGTVGEDLKSLTPQFQGAFHPSACAVKPLSPVPGSRGRQGHVGLDTSEGKWAYLCDVRTTCSPCRAG